MYMEEITVICQRCGSVIIEDDKINTCKHISKEEAEGFRDYLKRKLKHKNPKWEYKYERPSKSS